MVWFGLSNNLLNEAGVDDKTMHTIKLASEAIYFLPIFRHTLKDNDVSTGPATVIFKLKSKNTNEILTKTLKYFNRNIIQENCAMNDKENERAIKTILKVK